MTLDAALTRLQADLQATRGRTQANVNAAQSKRDEATAKAEATFKLACRAAQDACDRAVHETQVHLQRTTQEALDRFDEAARTALGLGEEFRIRQLGAGALEMRHGKAAPVLATAEADRGGWWVITPGGREFVGGGDPELLARTRLWTIAAMTPQAS